MKRDKNLARKPYPAPVFMIMSEDMKIISEIQNNWSIAQRPHKNWGGVLSFTAAQAAFWKLTCPRGQNWHVALI